MTGPDAMERLAADTSVGVEIRAEDARRGTTVLDPYTAGKMVEYSQGEMARSRGHRNWRSLFREHVSKSSR